MSAVKTISRLRAASPGAPMSAYERIGRLIAEQRCVVLDGATGTELIDVAGTRPEAHERLWGAREIVTAPDAVTAVHAAHVRAGCDVLSTNTWGLATALRRGDLAGEGLCAQPVHWMDVARTAVRLARAAAGEAGRAEEVAVAFSLNGDIDAEDGAETIRLLRRALEDEPPDLLLVETLSLVRPSLERTLEALRDTGLPIWLSFRRCRSGVCGVYGEHWGGPEGDAFGRAARRFEQQGVDALLVNCIPPDHVPGMVSWLRDFTDMPLGVYPNLGYLSDTGWTHDHGIDPEQYAELALGWRAEGAQIIGGCCGVSPAHIEAAASALTGMRPGAVRPVASLPSGPETTQTLTDAWTDVNERPIFPLPFPDVVVDAGVFPPDQASLLLWKHLMQQALGGYQRCLDVGSGCGLQAIQLLRNGASHVHAIDADPRAVRCTLANGFRNQVDERLSAARTDLFPWSPPERYDVVVASLDQSPVDPFELSASHRPRDYWGRNLIDHLVALLPELLADDGVAYVTQFSILGQQRTAQHLRAHGLACRVVDFAFEAGVTATGASRAQLERVEERSDAYHLDLGGDPLLVAYLLEITRIPNESETP